MKKHRTPLRALTDGAIAGAAGSLAQDLFFAATARWQPHERPAGFVPPEPEQKEEQPTETVARRLVEDLAQAGPLPPERKALGGRMVHYGFGAAWGALYGAAAESLPMLTSPLGASLFGAKVWALSDNVLLPAFGLAAPPARYGLATHAYGFVAHVVYGTAVMAAYRILGWPVTRPLLLASVAALFLLRPRPEEPAEPLIEIEEPIEPFATESAMYPSL